ncbi:MAG: hypothetical protein CMP14_03630, partial [Rickettsiales bacterium]|nr:hypothetical protein [Rickettsiales bacterium]
MSNEPIANLGKDAEHHNAEMHIRHLRETIGVIRGQLEANRFEKDAAVQQAVQHSADEIQQLKSTATSLRDELESLRFEKDAAVQQAVQRSADEIQQLKS